MNAAAAAINAHRAIDAARTDSTFKAGKVGWRQFAPSAESEVAPQTTLSPAADAPDALAVREVSDGFMFWAKAVLFVVNAVELVSPSFGNATVR